MNLGDLLQMAIGGGEEQDPSQAGLPPMTMGQYVNQVPTPVQDAAAQQGIYPKQGMEAIPFGPGGARGGMPAVGGQRGPMSGDLMGGPLVPRGNPVGASGPRGATYDGTVIPPQGTAVVPRGGPGGAGPGVGGPGGPGGGVPGGGGANVPGPGGTSLVPVGGAASGISGSGGGFAPTASKFSDFLKNAWNSASPFQKAGALGATGGIVSTADDALTSAWDWLTGDTQEAQAAPLPNLMDLFGGGQGGGYQVAAAPELPQVTQAEVQALLPEVDYASLPRPDYGRIRQALETLAPEAPEEQSFLEQIPSFAKSMIGFGLLLGPVGLALGAGLGMAENRFKEKAAADRFKEEQRQYIKEMAGFDIDWAKAERSMQLEEQKGAREQALENLTTQRSMQEWAMGDQEWQLRMQKGRTGLLNGGRRAGGDPFSEEGFDRLLLQAMMSDPTGFKNAYGGLAGADDTLMTNPMLPDGAKDLINRATQMQALQLMMSGQGR